MSPTQQESIHLIERLFKQNTSKSTRPLTTLSFAQSLDGIIGGIGNTPITLSCPESMIFTHCLRQYHDAILVGIGTVLSDNPRLNVRLLENIIPKHPRPVVIDPRLKIPLDSHLITQNRGLIVFYSSVYAVPKEKSSELSSKGVEMVATCPDENGRIPLKSVIEILKLQFSINSVMIEGGCKVIQDAFKLKDHLDYTLITVCPMYFGSGVRISTNMQLPNTSYQQFGRDLLLISQHIL